MKSRWLFVVSLTATSVIALGVFGVVRYQQLHTKAAEASWVGGGSTISEIITNKQVKVDAIVEGTFISSKSAPEQNGIRFTDFTFHVDKALYGVTSGSDITIHQTGGNGYSVTDDPLFKVGDRYILFLHQYSPGDYFVTGGPSGRFQIQSDGKISSYNPAHLADGETESQFIRSIASEVASIKK